MEVEYRATSSLIPYKNNPRINREAVKVVAESIKEFGFKVPIVVDKDGVIVAGHTRHAAAKRLKMKEVPVIVADDLTPQQINGFRLADNRTAEFAEWDLGKLEIELQGIDEIDMSSFGFDVNFDDDDDVPAMVLGDPDNSGKEYEPEEPERRKTYGEYTDEQMNLPDFDPDRAAGFYQMPTLRPCYYVPDRLVGFENMLAQTDFEQGIHFFIYDARFEKLWKNPEFYIEKISHFQCALTPDFSLYMDMPMAMKVWNVYRARLMGQMMQDAGIETIPCLQWAEPETFSFCFDGLPQGGTVAISTLGVLRSDEAQKVWRAGADEAMRRLKPDTVLLYGSAIGYDFGAAKVKQIKDNRMER